MSDCKNCEEMCIKIYEAIYNSDPEIMKLSPDALVRTLVYLAICNDWGLEKLENETMKGIMYYYSHMGKKDD